MNNAREERKSEMEIDVKRLVKAVWKKSLLIGFAAILCAVLTFLGTVYLVTPLYQSSAMFYVNNTSLSVGDATFSIESGDISAAKSLVNSYIVILQTRESLNDVIDYAGVNRTYAELSDMITAASVNSTEIFEVVVSSPDPNEAEKIASAIAYILPKRISSIIEGTSAKVVDSAVVASRPSSPNYFVNTVIGFLVGLVVMVCVIVLREFFDIRIRTEEDVTQNQKHPILAAVPNMVAPSKGSYYYSNGKRKEKKKVGLHGKQAELVGPEISFAASEAYKLLRTKLQFSFTDDKSCHVIGVSSALSGEGKSLSAVNMAYSLSQLDKRVLLIDCDMRRPTVAAKLSIAKSPGLSNYLSGQIGLEGIMQYCGIPGGEQAFAVLAAGRTPPNPVELLNSAKMEKMLDILRESYDYILLDLPPVGEVSDALVVAKMTDGILLVVRQNYCNRIVYNNTVHQFEFVGAKILGVVYNCATENNGNYGSKYYRKYGRGNYEAVGGVGAKHAKHSAKKDSSTKSADGDK